MNNFQSKIADDDQFQMLMTSTDALSLHLNYQRLKEQTKKLKEDHKQIYKGNLKLQQQNSLLKKSFNKKVQAIRNLSNDIIKLSKMVLEYDQKQQDFSTLVNTFQKQINQKSILIKSLQQSKWSQSNTKLSQLEQLNQQLKKKLIQTQKSLTKTNQRVEKLLLNKQQSDNSHKRITESLQYSLQFQKRNTAKYQEQIKLLTKKSQQMQLEIKNLIQTKQNILQTVQQRQQKSKTIDQKLIRQYKEQNILLKKELQIKNQQRTNLKHIQQEYPKLLKTVQQLQKKINDQQKKIKSLQSRYQSQKQLYIQLEQCKNMLQMELQQSMASQKEAIQQMQKYRQRLLHKPKLHLYDLKKNIEAYFAELNQYYRNNEEFQQKEKRNVIDTERGQLEDILKVYGKFSAK